MENENEAVQKMTRARTLLLLDHCFWGILSLKIKLVPHDKPFVVLSKGGPVFCMTACTDGSILHYYTEFVELLDRDRTLFLLAHEIMHCALGHIWRINNRNPTIANMAMDYCVNQELVDSGFTMIEGGLIDDRFKGMCFEEVYDILMKELLPQKKQGQGKGQGSDNNQEGKNGEPNVDPAGCGGVFQSADKDQQETEADWKTSVAQAIEASKGQGTLPGSLKKLLDKEMLDPPLPWNVLLAKFLEQTARNDYNWRKPNRRWLNRGIVLPSLISDELNNIVVANDTSGSTYDVQDLFANEISGILAPFKAHIHVIQCDANIQKVDEYDTEDLPIQFNIKGYGGTDFRPVFEYVEEKGLIPACLIYLTDMYGTFPEQAPDYPVMWISVTENYEHPFGEFIYLDKKLAKVGV